MENGLNLSERAFSNLVFFYLAKPNNEEEVWIRATGKGRKKIHFV